MATSPIYSNQNRHLDAIPEQRAACFKAGEYVWSSSGDISLALTYR